MIEFILLKTKFYNGKEKMENRKMGISKQRYSYFHFTKKIIKNIFTFSFTTLETSN